MKHIELFENLGNIFPQGKGPKKEYIKPIEIISDALSDSAIDLMKGNDQSKSLGFMVSEISRWLETNPAELQRVFVLVDGERDELQKISELTQNLTADFVPDGLDKEGFIKFRNLFSIMLNKPQEIADSLKITARTIYSLGAFLYYLFVSLFDDNMFNRIKGYFID